MNKDNKSKGWIKITIYVAIIIIGAVVLTRTSPALNYTEELKEYEVIEAELIASDNKNDNLDYYKFKIKYTIDGEEIISDVELLNSKFSDEYRAYKREESLEKAKNILGVLYYNKNNPSKVIKK